MKHVFFVHSGITYLISLAVIEYLNLSKDDVVIITSRSIPDDERFLCIPLNTQEESIVQLPSYGSVGVLRSILVLRNLDKKIASGVDHHSFMLYLPSDKNYLMQFLQSHGLCVGRNFIEEGLLTYRAGFLKPRMVHQRFGYVKNLFRFPYHLNRTRGVRGVGTDNFIVYVATQTAQRNLQPFSTVLLDIKKVKVHEEESDFTALFIFDAVVEMNLCSYENFMECLEDFIKEDVPRRNLAIKFHPFQKEYAQYLSIFEKCNVQYSLLGAEVIPEMLLSKRNSIAVYGLSSSVLFYAKEMGCEVHSFSAKLVGKDEIYRNYITQLIPESIIKYLRLV